MSAEASPAVVTLVTVEAAGLLGCTRVTVCRLARSGVLEAVQVDGQWLIDGASVIAYRARSRPRRRTSERRWYLPAAPLLRQIDLVGGDHECGVRIGETEKRALERARQSGRITLPAADQLAVHVLRMHPMEIWGDLFLVS